MNATTDPKHAAGAPAPAADRPVLDVAGLTISVRGEDGERSVVSDLSFALSRGETLCIAGESGSGKSMTSLAIMALLPQPAARISAGSIRLGDTDLAGLDERQMRRIRGNRIAMIFQEPMTSPADRGGTGSRSCQAPDTLRAHGPRDTEPGAQAWRRAEEASAY